MSFEWLVRIYRWLSSRSQRRGNAWRLRVLCWVLPIALFADGLLCSGADSDVPPARQCDAKTDTIARLIDQLASSNSTDDGRLAAAATNDPRIWKSVDALYALGIEAFPQLIAHFDDDRYSFEEDALSSNKKYRVSIGRLCWTIVDRQVTKYVAWKVADPRGTPGSGLSSVPSTRRDAEAWWEVNRRKPLWELQCDSIRRVIAANRERLQSEKAEDRLHAQEALLANQQLLAELSSKQTPIPTKPFRSYRAR